MQHVDVHVEDASIVLDMYSTDIPLQCASIYAIRHAHVAIGVRFHVDPLLLISVSTVGGKLLQGAKKKKKVTQRKLNSAGQPGLDIYNSCMA